MRHQSNTDRVFLCRFAPASESEPLAASPQQSLPRTMRADAGGAAHITQTLEDTRFYTHSVRSSALLGERVMSMHETLYVPRVASTTDQLMLLWWIPRLRLEVGAGEDSGSGRRRGIRSNRRGSSHCSPPAAIRATTAAVVADGRATSIPGRGFARCLSGRRASV